MMLRIAMLILGYSVSLFGDSHLLNSTLNQKNELVEAKTRCYPRRDAHRNHPLKKIKIPQMACIQLDFSDITTFQSSGDSDYAPAIGPDLSTVISGQPSHAHLAIFNPVTHAIRLPPGIYSIRCSGINDLLTIDGTVNPNIGYVTIYYSLDNGVTWNEIVKGNTGNLEFFNLQQPSFYVLFPFTETLLTVPIGTTLLFAYGLGSVNELNTTVSRNLSGRFIVEQVTHFD